MGAFAQRSCRRRSRPISRRRRCRPRLTSRERRRARAGPPSRSSRGSRSAARSPATARAARSSRPRALTPYQRLRERRVAQPVHAREVDHDRLSAAARRRPPGSFPKQRKITSAPSRAAASALAVKLGSDAVQPRVERVRGPARERVGAERDQLEPGMGERRGRASPGRCSRPAKDGHGSHDCVLCTIDGIYAQPRRGARARRRHASLPGVSVGAAGVASGEACFTTAMTGYEEAVTDPSYVAPGALLRLPVDRHLRRRRAAHGVGARAVRGRRDARRAARRSPRGCAGAGVVALSGVDTRTLVRRIRDGGVLRCALGEAPVEELHARALAEPPIDGRPLDRRVGATEPYSRRGGAPRGRRRPRLEALDPAPARRGRRSRPTSFPAPGEADEIMRGRAAASS